MMIDRRCTAAFDAMSKNDCGVIGDIALCCGAVDDDGARDVGGRGRIAEE